jgi:S1-C subfamily serine protease
MNTAIATNAQNIGFALPINSIKRDISSVKTSGKIQIPYLGVRYLTITPAIVQERGLAVSQGALVQGNQSDPAIMTGSPAEKAGFKEGDVITSINGVKLDEQHTLSSVISNLQVGQTVSVTYIRGGKEATTSITLDARTG